MARGKERVTRRHGVRRLLAACFEGLGRCLLTVLRACGRTAATAHRVVTPAVLHGAHTAIRRPAFPHMVLGILLVVGLVAFVGHVDRRTAESGAVRLRGVDLVLSPSTVGAHATPALAEEVVSRLQGSHLLDPTLVARAARVYMAFPWVERVISVERRFPDRLRVRVVPRRPVAAARALRGRVILDHDALVLPSRYYTVGQGTDALPLLVGLPDDAVAPADGHRWSHPAVRDGTAIAAIIAAEAAPLPVQHVDLTNWGGRENSFATEVVLVFPDGMRVEWGRPPGRSGRGEPAPAEKLAAIREILARFGGTERVAVARVQFPVPRVRGR